MSPSPFLKNKQTRSLVTVFAIHSPHFTDILASSTEILHRHLDIHPAKISSLVSMVRERCQSLESGGSHKDLTGAGPPQPGQSRSSQPDTNIDGLENDEATVMASMRVELKHDDFLEVADGRFEKGEDGKVVFRPKKVRVLLFEIKLGQYRINLLSAPFCQEELSAEPPGWKFRIIVYLISLFLVLLVVNTLMRRAWKRM